MYRYVILFILSLFVFTSFGLAQVAPELFVEADESSLNSLQATYLATIKNRQTTVMYRVVRIPVLNAFQNFPIIELNLFPNKKAQATQQFVERRSETDFTWTGGIEDRMGSVILVVNSIGLTGSIRFDNELFKVESLGGDYHVITKIDRSKSPPEHPVSKNDNGDSNALSKAVGVLDITMSSQSTSVIDLLVLYTASVASNYPNISGLIQFDEDETNLSYQHSSVNASVNVVHHEQVNYIEFGGYSEHLDWFMNSSTVNALRDQYSADVCVLLVNDTSSCGKAADIPASESTAYCVVHYDNAVCDLSFPHEIGHLQGGRHHFEDDKTPGPHHGYNDPFGVYRTVMTTFRDNPCPTCVRVDYWSNPNVYWNNEPNQPMGTVNKEYNVSALNANSPTISNFRTPPPPPLAPQNLIITNAGSIGLSPNLSWDASSGAASYKVYRCAGYYQSCNWQVIATPTNTSYTDWEVIITEPEDAYDKFYYYVTAVNSGGESSGSNIVSTWGDTFFKWFIETETRPESFALLPNYPNPFNPQTELRYTLASAGYVELVITNLLGQPVRSLVAESQPADWHRIVWDGRNDQGKLVASGIYLYHITVQTNNGGEIFTKVRKMSLLR